MKTYSYQFKTGKIIEVEGRSRNSADNKFRKACLKQDLYGIYDVYVKDPETGVLYFIQTQSTNHVEGK